MNCMVLKNVTRSADGISMLCVCDSVNQDAAAVVTVNENPTWRSGEYFYGGDYADNTRTATNKQVEIVAVLPAAAPGGEDEISAVTGRVFVAKTPEVFTYDADGNMTSDGRFAYTWNAENRMVSASNAEVVVTYAYDHKGRMIRKTISRGDAEPQSITYLWDGWNIIREAVATNSLFTIPSSLFTYNLWGLDLDGTMQGAGGVGGLLAVVRDGETYLPTYDANGNVSEYVSATDGTIAAHYDYSPFGETLVASGPQAASFTHRFSTKPYCQTTGFCEYQMRKYCPDIGRWMSRDPMGEEGGGLFLFLLNNPLIQIDLLGLAATVTVGEPEQIPDSLGMKIPFTPKDISDGCELNFIQIVFNIENRSYEVDAKSTLMSGGSVSQPLPPYYYNRQEIDLQEGYKLKDGTMNFVDEPTVRTVFFLFAVERCCLESYNGSCEASCCKKSRATVLSRLYWTTKNGKAEVKEVSDRIRQFMDQKLKSLIHEVEFKNRCVEFMKDNKNNKGQWGMPTTVELNFGNAL